MLFLSLDASKSQNVDNKHDPVTVVTIEDAKKFSSKVMEEAWQLSVS